MAIAAGMTSAITNPLHDSVMAAVLGADVMMGHDPNCARWIKKFRGDWWKTVGKGTGDELSPIPGRPGRGHFIGGLGPQPPQSGLSALRQHGHRSTGQRRGDRTEFGHGQFDGATILEQRGHVDINHEWMTGFRHDEIADDLRRCPSRRRCRLCHCWSDFDDLNRYENLDRLIRGIDPVDMDLVLTDTGALGNRDCHIDPAVRIGDSHHQLDRFGIKLDRHLAERLEATDLDVHFGFKADRFFFLLTISIRKFDLDPADGRQR